ncbi:MAG: ABC transporter permease [Candidatus Hydrogenedentota bacterium]
MKRFFAVVHAIGEREFAGKLSYRFSFIFNLISMMLIFVAIFYVGKMIPPEFVPGGDYFTMTVIGIGIYTWIGTLASAPRAALMMEMSFGTFETIILLLPSMEVYLLASSLYFALLALARTGFILLVPFILGWRCPPEALVMLLPVFLLSGLAGIGLGLLQTGLDLRVRRAGRLVSLFGGGGAILSGVYFPVALLPVPLQMLSGLIPATHAIDAARTILIGHALPLRAGGAMLFLAIVFCIAGHGFFRYAENAVRRDGSFLS